jgi:hypothetical protein
LIDIETNYPTTPHELKVRVTETLGVSAAYVVVTSADFPESEEKEKEEDYEVLLTSPYPKDKDKDKPYGDKFNQEFLKDIKTRKHKIAGKPAPKAKTLNDEKQGNTSPIGSK